MYHYTNLPFILFKSSFSEANQFLVITIPPNIQPALVTFCFTSYRMTPLNSRLTLSIPPSSYHLMRLIHRSKGILPKVFVCLQCQLVSSRLSNLLRVPLHIQTIVLHSFPYLYNVSLPASVLPVHPLPAWTTIPPRITCIPKATPIQQYHCSNVFSLPLHTPM